MNHDYDQYGTKLKYYVGDNVWVHGIVMRKVSKNKTINELTPGKVVHVFQLDWGPEYYVIQIETSIDPELTIRSSWAISQDERGPIGLYRRIEKMQ